MNRLDTIYTFGTSCTAGGGFEFNCDYKLNDLRGNITKKRRGEFIRSIYTETPYTQNQYSWPGQLEKLLKEKNKNIKVVNISKQGYGNERIYRKFFDLLKNGEIKNKDRCFFIFEFSDLSRKEFWHSPSKNHIIMNYLADDDKPQDCTIAKSYFYDKQSDRKIYNKDYWIFKKYREDFIEVDNESKDVSRNLLLFLEFLKFNDFKFGISSMPELIHPQYYDLIMEYDNLTLNFGFDDGKKYKSFHRFQDLEKLTISHETSGAYRDMHGSLFSNKIIAKNVFNQLIDKKYLDDEIIPIPKIINFKENLKNTLM